MNSRIAIKGLQCYVAGAAITLPFGMYDVGKVSNHPVIIEANRPRPYELPGTIQIMTVAGTAAAWPLYWGNSIYSYVNNS